MDNHLIIEPGSGKMENASVSIEPGCPSPPPENTPTIPAPNPSEDGVEQIFCGSCDKPPHRPPPCPPADNPPGCRPLPPNNPCCEDDPRFVMKRLILLERELKKLIDFVGGVLGDNDTALDDRLDEFKENINNSLDNFSKNICDANKLISSDITDLDRRVSTNEEMLKELDQLPVMQADITTLQECCNTSREFIQTTTENFSKAYADINEISNELKDDVHALDMRVSSAEEMITGVDGFNQALSQLNQRVTNEVKLLNTTISTHKNTLQFSIDELAATVSDISQIRNNVAYVKNYCSEVANWINGANEAFIEIRQDIVNLTKEVEKLQ